MPFRLHGEPTPEKIGHPLDYYRQRDIRLDCRGDLRIHPGCHIAQEVMIITAGHDPRWSHYGRLTYRPVHVDEGAFIYNKAILFDCHIGKCAIVRPGTVVASRDVPPYTIVEGNPAQIVARWDHGCKAWYWLPEPEDIPLRQVLQREENWKDV